jgi:hypothetical protein
MALWKWKKAAVRFGLSLATPIVLPTPTGGGSGGPAFTIFGGQRLKKFQLNAVPERWRCRAGTDQSDKSDAHSLNNRTKHVELRLEQGHC